MKQKMSLYGHLFSGKLVRLDDIADINEGFEESNVIQKMDGNLGITLMVLKKNLLISSRPIMRSNN